MGDFMFCPSCGLESTQKTNYCKRCGGNMNPAANVVEITMPKPRVMGMAITIVAFSLIGLLTSVFVFDKASNLLLGEKLLLVFIACLFFVLSVTGSLILQVYRLIPTFHE